MDLFKEFKTITQEEDKIIGFLKELSVNKNSEVLDIGGNNGHISKSIQPNTEKITIVDVEEFHPDANLRFIKDTWENAKIDKKFDLIIASHVWGHFEHEKTQRLSFNKMIKAKKKRGLAIICYNTNNDFVGKLVNFSKELFPNFQYDVFDENLLQGFDIEEKVFSVKLVAESFEKLAELCWILIIANRKIYKRKVRKVQNFLEKNLEKPEFSIEQKIVFLK